jgi:hypothetical protein
VLGLFAKPSEDIVNGPWHYKRGEWLLASAADLASTGHLTELELANQVAAAQAHFTAALVATQAEARSLHWDEVLT